MSSRMAFGFQLQLLLSFPLAALASYCGQSGIPMSLEISNNGQPVLGCARPTCFGWTADGKRSADAALFYKIGGQMDGYLRPSDQAGPAVKNASIFQPQFSICERTYISDRCVGPQQWVGGIAPMPKIDSHESMKIMCCMYERLRDSVSKGTLKVRAGQSVQGGEMRNAEGRQHGFEYVANVERMFDEHGVVYTVHMRSFKCVPEPNGPTEVEDKVEKMLIENIDAVTSTTTRAPKTSRTSSLPTNGSPAKFDEQTFELPEEMPAEESSPSSSKRLSTGIPFAVPYEVDAIQTTLNEIPRQPSKESGVDSDAFRARARGAPTLTDNTPQLRDQQTALGLQPLAQSHSPYYQQVPANPFDPLGLFSIGNGPFANWYYPTTAGPPVPKLMPLETKPVDLPSVEQVESAIPEAGKQIIQGVSRVLRSLSQRR